MRLSIPVGGSKIALSVFFFVLAGFSVWLMWHTFGYDSETGDLLVSAKVYSDFGSHLPLVRSFSLGSNWPPQYPLFPGEPVRYHYLFYLFAGLLEKFGLRLDFALNLPGAAGFFSLSLLVFLFGRRLFSSVAAGVLSVVLFLFNGSFSFLDFLSTRPLSPDIFHQLTSNSAYPAFAPWNHSLISAFWNLNIYTNQRHLGFSFAVCLLLIYFLYSGRRLGYLVSGFLFGSLLLLNQAGFLICLVFVSHRLLLNFPSVKNLIRLVSGFLPWLFIYVFTVGLGSARPVFQPGYLLSTGSTVVGIFLYWLNNLGLHLFLIPVGLLLAPPAARRLWLPLLLLFLLPNLFRFSPDMVNNHKLFNFFLIVGNMFTAGLLVRLWSGRLWAKLFVVFLFPWLILGGVVDFFPLKNDYFLRIPDLTRNSDARFFADHTPPGSIILNDTWFYHPASLAGRPIFNGYPYFTWSYGYDQVDRETVTRRIYASPSVDSACNLLLAHGIDYIQTQPRPEDFLAGVDRSWLRSFTSEYSNNRTGFTVYSVAANCRQI